MKRISLVVILLSSTLLLVACPGNKESKSKKPNILFILVDDLGYSDLGCYGSSFYETPNLDKLAAESMRFTNSYSAGPVCSPTRSSIMTGKYPVNTGITDYIGRDRHNQPENWERPTKLLPAPYKDRLPLEEKTVAELLKENGYATFFAGKWHLGPEGFFPEDQGFDINKGGCSWGQPFGEGRYFVPYENSRLEDGPEGEYLTFRLGEEIMDFIKNQQSSPFFAFLSFYSVHTPLMAPDSIEQKYMDKRKRLGVEEEWGEINGRKLLVEQSNPVYAGMVESVDYVVGKILNTLEFLDLDENTIIIFTSDNGGAGKSTSCIPLKASKGWLYEGGIRVPLIIKWPGVTKPGSISGEITTSPDFMPTIMAITGIKDPGNLAFDGINITPALAGEALPSRPVYWHFPHYSAGPPGAAIRFDEYKLIEWYENGSLELFNLSDDIGEMNDLSEEKAEIADELFSMLKEWQEKNAVLYPELKRP